MQETAGKAAAREYFYKIFLPTALTPKQINFSNFLLLLGENFKEMELLSELGVPAYRVFSVERDKKIFDRQKRLNQREEYGAALHYGGLEDYLRHYQFTDHKFRVFNLDICGPYLSGIDPAMGEILMFARRNPQTVVATYSSAGRDRQQLQEGLKSLAFLLWLDPASTNRLASSLFEQYASSNVLAREKSCESVAKNMMLRHFFWLRSHLEHIALSSYVLGKTSQSAVRRLSDIQELIWSKIVEEAEFPLTYKSVTDQAVTAVRRVVPKIGMDLGFNDVQNLTYSAYNGFYQCCYFVTYETLKETIDLAEWYSQAVSAMLNNQTVMIDNQGQYGHSSYEEFSQFRVSDSMVLWDKSDLSRKTRHLGIPPIGPEVAELIDAVEANPIDDEIEEDAEEAIVDNGKLSEAQIAQIRRLAASGRSTDFILFRLALDKRHRGSVRAYVATVSRQNNQKTATQRR